ncbi:MAG TPA: ABC transporter ATP-binding protein [Burkholderiales bacterium]|jgi:ABC-type sugar transport system ATPase subunit|nr:ABC transporter ATP-binding protein [Burkholderiales bacterium]
MAAIAFDRVSKRFGATVVADELTLEVVDGEFFVFLGPSGSGKSTLLHMIAGVEPPSAGRIRIGGADVTDVPPQKRDVAMVFQSYALYPHLDVAENLAFPLRNRGVSRGAARAEAERVAAVLGLAGLLDKKPRQLSGGQRQRVALGRALVRRPAAFLMDEPLSNLDAALRIEIREEIKRVHQAHRVTTVYVTHDQEEALALADRVAVLRDGRVQQCAAPAAIYGRPADAFVARFVGTPPMNLVSAAALAQNPALRARLAGRDPAGVTVGLRPHALEAHPVPRPDAIALEVALVEPAGADTWVVAGTGEARLKGRLASGASLAPGAMAHFAFAVDAVHLFDAASGRRLD